MIVLQENFQVQIPNMYLPYEALYTILVVTIPECWSHGGVQIRVEE